MGWLPALQLRRLAFCVGVGVVAAVAGCGSSDAPEDDGDGGAVVLASTTIGGQRLVLEERLRTGRACIRKANREVVGACLAPIAADHLQGAALRLDRSVLVYGRAPRDARTLDILVGSMRRESSSISSSRGFIAAVVTNQRRPKVRIRTAGCHGDLRLTDRSASLRC